MMNDVESRDARGEDTGLVTDLQLLIAQKAAAILEVDVKTFRGMGADFIRVGKSKRYTVSLLRAWLQRNVQECPAAAPSPTPRWARKRTYIGKVRRCGEQASSITTLADFERIAGLKPRKPAPVP
jgi:hypothetical protein